MPNVTIFDPLTGGLELNSNVSLQPVGSSPNANAGSLDSLQNLTLQPANASFPGVLLAADWNTFNNKQPALGYTPENVANKGIANGYAGLDGSGKVPYAQLPSALMTFKGAWNASTNSPALADGTGTNGDVYRASVAGTQNLGSGPQTWAVGDFAIYNGSIWQHSPAADGVSSVNGLTGAVTLTQGNLTETSSSVLTISGGTNSVWGAGTSIQVSQATTSGSGYLSSTDWNTFNGKQASGNYITALTGDATASGPGSSALTLATVNSNVGSFGSSTSIPSFTVNAKGLITAAGSNTAATSSVRAINTQTGTTYTFALTDGSNNGTNPLVTGSNAATQTYTIPTNASVAFPVGTQIDLTQLGAGKITIAPAGGVTLNSQGGLFSIGAQYVGVSLIQLSANNWILLGNLIA